MAPKVKSINGMALVDVEAVKNVNNTAPDENGNLELPVYGGEYEEIYAGEYEEVTSNE